MKTLKYTGGGLMVAVISLVSFSLITQRNVENMTVRQKLLRTVYPAFMWVTKLVKSNREIILHSGGRTPVDFYSLQAKDITGTPVDLRLFRGKKLLIVNTASDCGYTAQYDELEKLHQQYHHQLTILAFPANDFKQQEKGNEAAIAAFCRKNYGVSFPLMEKSGVLPGPHQHEVYRWLTQQAQNGWNSRAPAWNFSKYLVDEQGRLRAYLGPSVSPLDPALISLLQ